MKTKTIPLNALKFAAQAAEFGQESEDGSIPVKMVALSGEPITHWWFGQCVQDLAGMNVKESISIDYCHNDDELIGVADKFSTDNNQLEIEGQIIPFTQGDRASEVAFRSKKGTPYEASIFFPESKAGDIKIEELEAGEQAEVNGQTVHGPITIFRKWPLRRVAICPSGADGDTLAMAQSTNENQKVEVEIMATKKPEENKEPEKTPEVVPEKQTAEPEKVAPVAEPKEEKPTVQNEIGKYCQSFGDELGFKYLKEGLSFEAAQSAFNLEMLKSNEELKKENEELKTKQTVSPEPFNPSGDGDDAFFTSADEAQIRRFQQKLKSTGASYEELKAQAIARNKEKAAQKVR